MLPDSGYAHAVGSFPNPLPLPVQDPDASPNKSFTIACSWLPYVRGALQQLLLQSTWDTDDPVLLNLVQSRAFSLIAMLEECTGSPVFPFACPYDFLSSGEQQGWSGVDDEGCPGVNYAVWDGTGFEPGCQGCCSVLYWQMQLRKTTGSVRVDTVSIIYSSAVSLYMEIKNNDGSNNVVGGVFPSGELLTASFVVNKDYTRPILVLTTYPFTDAGSSFKVTEVILTGYSSTGGCP